RAGRRLEEQLSQLGNTGLNNKTVLKKLIPLNNEVVADYKGLKATLKPFAAKLNKLATGFKALDEIDIEKSDLSLQWDQAFADLQEIDVTNNMDTYHKFAAFADLDVERLKYLEKERESLSILKAAELDAETDTR